MNLTEILEKAKEFCEYEYQDCKKSVKRKYTWITPQGLVDNSIARCLGVVQFVQELGVEYKDLGFYDEYLEKFKKLLDNKEE
jgi:hypothetical protein